jgi:hypothetical protein
VDETDERGECQKAGRRSGAELGHLGPDAAGDAVEQRRSYQPSAVKSGDKDGDRDAERESRRHATE